MIHNPYSPVGKPVVAAPQSLANGRRRILVVDDEPLIRLLNTDILEGAGYEVDTAEDGAAAWDALQVSDYDLLVTDNQMPTFSGVDLVLKIREAGMILPVIMATGTPPEEEFSQHPWLYPFAMLLKPYSLAELSGAVKALLRAPGEGGVPMELMPNWECRPQVFGARL